MSSGSDKNIELRDEKIIIHNLEVDDINAYKILKDIKPDRREEFIKKAVIMGTIGLRNLSLTENVDYIEKEFNKLLKQFEYQNENIQDMIEKTFDMENNASCMGKFRLMFEQYFDLKKGKIGDLLSPYEEGSPIKKLKEEVFEKIKELRDELLKEEVKEEIVSKTTLKGGKFEDTVLEQIEKICSPYEDKVEYVGDRLGKTNKIGDINIDIDSDNKKRIIVECKDSPAYSHKRTIDEVNDAIKNRGSKFGIFLFKNQQQIPSALRPVKITKKYIVTSFDEYGLYFAFRVARLFVTIKDDKKEIPIGEIQKEIEDMKSKLFMFKSFESKLTQIDNASSYIRTNLERIKDDIENSLETIKNLIT